MPVANREKYNAYMRIYMLDRWHKRRARGIAQLGGVCTECGATDELEFDHVDPSQKTFTISRWSSCSERLFQEELAKCVLRCKPCHKRRTSEQRSVAHGGGLTGKKHCYCELCGAKKREYARNKQYKKKRRERAVGA